MTWSWKSKLDIIIFSFIGLFFGLNTLVHIYYDDYVYTNDEIISLILIFLGYIFLFILNYKKKWIFGIIIVSLLMLMIIYRLVKMYLYIHKKIYRSSLKKFIATNGTS